MQEISLNVAYTITEGKSIKNGKINQTFTIEEIKHIKEIEAICKERKYSITDLLHIIFDCITPDIAEEILFRQDSKSDYPINI